VTSPEPTVVRVKVRRADGAEDSITVPVIPRKDTGPVAIKIPVSKMTESESRQTSERLRQEGAGDDDGTRCGRQAREQVEEMRQPLPDQLRSQRQAFLRRAARDLLRELNRCHEWLPE
jgi:hypothetical protein